MDDISKIREKIQSFGFSDYLRALPKLNKMLESADLKPLRIAVLRSYTSEMMEPILTLRLLLEGYRPSFSFGDFNQYAQEIIDLDSFLYRFKPDVVLFLIRLEEVLPELIDNFGQTLYADWEKVIRNRADELTGLISALNARHACQVLVQNLASPAYPYWGAYDAQLTESQTRLVHLYNQSLAEVLLQHSSSFIWDFNGLVRRLGAEHLFDPKSWYSTHNPYAPKAYPAIGCDLFKYLLSAIGRQKKCIVLDLDNTLWGGVAGEDGIEGVKLGHEYPGNCFKEFQKSLLKLYHRGIILAINSKNNEEDAWEIVDNHPDMVLKRNHFASYRINWNDKGSNLAALSNDLNIGIDSMVFIDDNPVECELVRQRHPDCEVICLPEKPYLIPGVVASLVGFENLKLTDEDRQKGQMYQAQVARKNFATEFKDLETFLQSLEMNVTIEAASKFSIPRIAQLTQKTNQMNLTTRRYTDANIEAFVSQPNHYVFSVSAKDRFGDNGIVGVFILWIDNGACIVDTFLLSCRVISRNIENVMMAFIADFANKQGAKRILGEFIPTRKNKPAADLYHKLGFSDIGDNCFQADLDKLILPFPTYIDVNI